MIIRALDTNHDWTFGKGKSNYLNQQLAIAENVQTRLLSFLNDCYFDLDAGVDWLNLMGTMGITDSEIELTCRAVILQSYGVVRVNSISINRNRSMRNIYLSYNIDTIYTSQFSQTLGVIPNA